MPTPLNAVKVRNCGHCHASHLTVAQARLCAKRYYDGRRADAEARAEHEAGEA